MFKKRFFPALGALLLLFLAACNGAASQEQDEEATQVPVVIDDFAVVAEGRLVPSDSVNLGFVSAGRVAEILVEEGDLVRKGDVLARLGDREQLEAAVAAAQLEQSAAVLELASAQLDLLSAEQALQAIHDNWPQQATAAQQALKDARQRLHNADKNLGYLSTPADQADIDLAYTQVVLAENALEKAEEDFEPFENKRPENLTRAALQSKLAAAQKAYDTAVRHYNALRGTANDFDLSQGEAEFAIAAAQLENAQDEYDRLIDGPDPDDVTLAEARIATAQARIATGEERTRTAQANLAAAQANLDHLDLTATIDGTVVDLNLILGEQVTPGAPVLLLVDFSEWYVETDNLTEIEVVDVSLGQRVTVVPDAMTELTLTGTVDKINDVFEEKRGDITYPTRILIDEMDPRLRWGMTVVVTFEK